MTYRAWWAARRLMFEERYGSRIREHELEERAKEAQKVSDYLRSVELLKQRAEHGAG